MKKEDLQQQIHALDARAQTIQGERVKAQQEHDAARTMLGSATEAKDIAQASENVARSRMRLEALSEALSDVQADISTHEAQIATLEAQERHEAYAQELASIAAEAEALVCEFERERELVSVALADGLARLGQIREKPKAPRQRFIQRVLAGFPDLAQLRVYSNSDAETRALEARASQLRDLLAERGASLAALRAWEPTTPALYEGVGARIPAYELPSVTMGAEVDALLEASRAPRR